LGGFGGARAWAPPSLWGASEDGWAWGLPAGRSCRCRPTWALGICPLVREALGIPKEDVTPPPSEGRPSGWRAGPGLLAEETRGTVASLHGRAHGLDRGRCRNPSRRVEPGGPLGLSEHRAEGAETSMAPMVAALPRGRKRHMKVAGRLPA